MEKLKFISSYSELFAFCTWLPHVFFAYPFLCLPLPPTPILCMAMCFSGLFCTISDSSVWVLMPPSMLLWQPVFFLFMLVCKWVFLVNASFSTVSFLRGETLPALSLCSQCPVWYLSCASWLCSANIGCGRSEPGMQRQERRKGSHQDYWQMSTAWTEAFTV